MRSTSPSAFVCPDCGGPLVIETSDTDRPLECEACGRRFTAAGAKLKQFPYLYYRRECPAAQKIEDIVNGGCNGQRDGIEKCLLAMPEGDFAGFIFGCLLYWSHAERYDDRNRYAVLASRRILERFPNIAVCIHDDDRLREACGFTREAHRHLQQEFFRLAMAFLKERRTFGIAEWFDSQDFVYANDRLSLVPRAEWHHYSI